MLPQELYFLSTEKYRPALFGIPLVVSYSINTTGQELYSWVWEQVTRLVSPLPPQDKTQHNHATDCDDSLGKRKKWTKKISVFIISLNL